MYIYNSNRKVTKRASIKLFSKSPLCLSPSTISLSLLSPSSISLKSLTLRTHPIFFTSQLFLYNFNYFKNLAVRQQTFIWVFYHYFLLALYSTLCFPIASRLKTFCTPVSQIHLSIYLYPYLYDPFLLTCPFPKHSFSGLLAFICASS